MTVSPMAKAAGIASSRPRNSGVAAVTASSNRSGSSAACSFLAARYRCMLQTCRVIAALNRFCQYIYMWMYVIPAADLQTCRVVAAVTFGLPSRSPPSRRRDCHLMATPLYLY